MSEDIFIAKRYAVAWCSIIIDTNPFKMPDEKFLDFLEEGTYKKVLVDLKNKIAKDKKEILAKLQEGYNTQFSDSQTFKIVTEKDISEGNIEEKEKDVDNEEGEKDTYIKFPKLFLKKDDTHTTAEIKVTINPCFGGSPNTKIIAVPMEVQGNLLKDEILEFFKEMKKVLTSICKKICDIYIEILKGVLKTYPCFEKEPLKLEQSDVFYLHAYVIGSEDITFEKVIKDSNNTRLLEKTVEDSDILKESIDILKQIRIPQNGQSYHWFKKEIITAPKIKKVDTGNLAMVGLFGYLRKGNHANFVGLTSHNPRKITKMLMQEAYKTM